MKEVHKLAKLYRDTGIWTKDMENIQNKHIVWNIQDFFDSFKQDNIEDRMEFFQYIGLRKGLWQAKHGFTRTMEQVRTSMNKKTKDKK